MTFFYCTTDQVRVSLICVNFSPPPVKPEGTIGLHSVCPSVSLSVCLSVCPSHLFSGLFFAMLSHIWMKVVSKLLYEELQIKFDFRHGWPIFSWVIALCSKFVFRSFLAYAFTYMNESWWQASIWRVTDQVRLLSRLTYFFMSYKLIAIWSKFVFRTF